MAVGIITFLDPVAQFQKANDAKRKSDLNQIQKALETYYQDMGKYPDTDRTDKTNYKIKGLDGNAVEWGTSWLPYMSVLPKDPASTKHYEYFSLLGQTYFIFASLDRGGKDPQACQRLPGVFECRNADLLNPKRYCGGSTICDYGVSSPNTRP